jgi:ABC-type antimicrobial peptide transport system permease subunit
VIVTLALGLGANAAMGIAVGTALALAAAHWLQPLLFQQSAKDPLVYGAVGGTMLLVTLVASAVPAMRAAKADPNVALRSD